MKRGGFDQLLFLGLGLHRWSSRHGLFWTLRIRHHRHRGLRFEPGQEHHFQIEADRLAPPLGLQGFIAQQDTPKRRILIQGVDQLG